MITTIADKAIWGAGPVFIALAVILVDMCVLAYYLVVFPYSHNWFEANLLEKLYIIATFIFTIYMVYSIHFHYYMAITTSPGTTANDTPQPRSSDDPRGESSSTAALLEQEESADGSFQPCKKCHMPKPERAHHCSVCNRCILRFDHHCPWIHNCVGHNNHRYFVLFMTYMILSAAYFVFFGWRPFIVSLDFMTTDWPYYYPRALMAFSLILAGCMGVALSALCGWHYYLIFSGQTTVEFYDNYHDSRTAKSQGEIFVNAYNFGPKENWCRFFNIGKEYRWYTIFFPIPIPPKGNGRIFEKCDEYHLLPTSRHSEDTKNI